MTFDPNTLLGGYTEAQLQASFNIVANKENWKRACHATLPSDTPYAAIKQLAYAITFYTGSTATFAFNLDGTITVTAPGYYSAIGA